MAEKRTRLSDMTKAGRKAEKPTVIGAIRDPQFVRDVLQGLGETATRGITGVLGAPVDITTMAMRPFGYSVPAKQVVGGSEYLGKQLERAGMLSGNRNQLSELLAGLVTPDPVDAAKLGAMFIGPLAKTWDAEAAAKAARMELEGADPRAIWSETGTFRGPEGKWRQEIPDIEAQPIKQTGTPLEYMQDFSAMYPSELGKVLSHEKAYEAYPDLPQMRAVMQTYPGAGYAPPTDVARERIEFPFRHERGTGEIRSPEESKSALLHEIQHAIQQREGFSTGGNPDIGLFQPEVQRKIEQKIAKLPERKRNDPKEIEKIRDKISYDWYMKLAGEAEARATQARMGMTAAERRAMFPAESYDIPIKKLLVTDMEKIKTNIPKKVTITGKE